MPKRMRHRLDPDLQLLLIDLLTLQICLILGFLTNQNCTDSKYADSLGGSGLKHVTETRPIFKMDSASFVQQADSTKGDESFGLGSDKQDGIQQSSASVLGPSKAGKEGSMVHEKAAKHGLEPEFEQTPRKVTFAECVVNQQPAKLGDMPLPPQSASGAGSVPMDRIAKEDTRGMVNDNVTWAAKVTEKQPVKKANFRKLLSQEGPNGEYEAMIPLNSVKEVCKRLDNTIYGYFIGKRLAFPIVENYVYNAWAKYGVQKVMLNSKGFFFFKFANQKGVDDVLENGPWLIRKVPIILNKWTPGANLTKENHDKVPVWVKMHNVPITAFTEDGISTIASLIGDPLRLDSYTSSMCMESWGRSSFARAMIEVDAKADLKEEVTIAIPSFEGDKFESVSIKVEFEWKPPHCGNCKLFGHGIVECPKNVKAAPQIVNKEVQNAAGPTHNHTQFKPFRGLVVGNKKKVGVGKPKQVYVPKKTSKESASTSNTFDLLNQLDDDGNISKENRADSGKVSKDLKKKKAVSEPIVANVAKNNSEI